MFNDKKLLYFQEFSKCEANVCKIKKDYASNPESKNKAKKKTHFIQQKKHNTWFMDLHPIHWTMESGLAHVFEDFFSHPSHLIRIMKCCRVFKDVFHVFLHCSDSINQIVVCCGRSQKGGKINSPNLVSCYFGFLVYQV
jgi:hypothetical protein